METDESQKPFTELFEQYKGRTYDFALRMLGDPQAASDVAQDAFLRLFEHQQNHHRIGDVKSWLFIVARNLCLNRIRNRSKYVSLDGLEDRPTRAHTAADPRQRALRRALLSLDSPYRETIVLKAYQGFTYQEMAEILGKTVPAIRSLLYKARSMLRDRLESE